MNTLYINTRIVLVKELVGAVSIATSVAASCLVSIVHLVPTAVWLLLVVLLLVMGCV